MNGFWKELDPRTVRNPETSYFQWTRHNVVNTHGPHCIDQEHGITNKARFFSKVRGSDRSFPVQHAPFVHHHSPDFVAAADIKSQGMVATRKQNFLALNTQALSSGIALHESVCFKLYANILCSYEISIDDHRRCSLSIGYS